MKPAEGITEMCDVGQIYIDRMWSRVRKTDACWVWLGCRVGGYGQMGISDRKRVFVHRLAYAQLVGPIPDGMTLDHLCRNRSCVRPDHLEAVTQRTNVLRGVGRSAVNARKTACPRGHAYTPENTRWSRKKRHCRECDRRAKCAARHKKESP